MASGYKFGFCVLFFDPTSKPLVESDSSNGGGRGLVLLQAYADELTYTHDGSYNRIKFKIKSS